MLTRCLKKRKRQANVTDKLVQIIIAQSRSEYLYQDIGVPDTFIGRFDSLCLHAGLLVHYLNDYNPKQSNQIFGHIMAHIDFSLREIGIGDMSIKKHMKRALNGFHGRTLSLMAALEKNSTSELEQVLNKNLFGSSKALPDHETMDMAKLYIVKLNSYFKNIDPKQLTNGNLDFSRFSDHNLFKKEGEYS